MTRSIKLPRLKPTDEHTYLGRRTFIKQLGLGALSLSLPTAIGSRVWADDESGEDREKILRPGIERDAILAMYPFTRNKDFDLEGKLTPELAAGTHNNFYELLPGRAGPVWRYADDFEPDPWAIEISGECHRPAKFDIDAIYKLAKQHGEERTCHFRCVEAWAMDVPWSGFELSHLIKAVEPTGNARFVRFITAGRPRQMHGIPAQPHYPWPYFEGLRMDEATHPLTLLATGIYGRPLPRQHGAPFRLVVPWKYGYKSIKSIVKIELLARQPRTFWETLHPREYPFEANVDPDVAHPQWSQATERLLDGDKRDTRKYNGYGEYVAKLYE